MAVYGDGLGVQQPGTELVNAHPGFEQGAVMAARSGGHGEVVVAGGEDERGRHAAVGRGAQRGLQRGHGHVIRRGDDQLMPRSEDERLEQFGHGGPSVGGAGGDDLGDEAVLTVLDLRQGLDQQGGEVVAVVAHPVRGEEVLVLAHHRAFEAHEQIDPGAVFRLGQEGGVGAVLAAAVAQAVVDDDDLAVIAQVDATPQRAQQRIAYGQRPQHLHASGDQRRPLRAADERVRSEVVHQGAAAHAARGGAAQGIGHAAAVAIVQPDIEEQVHAVLRRVDVGHDAGDGGVRVGHQFGAVAADRRVAADRCAEAEQRRVLVGRQRGVCRPAGGGFRTGQAAGDGAQPLGPSTADLGRAKQQIGQNAEVGKGHQHEQPGHPRLGLTMRAQQHMRRAGQRQREVQQQEEQGRHAKLAGFTPAQPQGGSTLLRSCARACWYSG